MPDLREILDRIKDILSDEIGHRKVFDKDVAEALDINQVSFATMKSRSKIPYKEILEFCAKRKISINWLMFNQVVGSLTSQSEKFERVHYFKDIYASAGGGALNYDEQSDFLTLDEEMVNHLGGKQSIKNIHALNVLGDSMEPTLNDGDIVFMDRESKNPNKNGVYIVSTPVGLFIKRLQLKSDGMVALVSDNESYSDELVNADDIEVLGKVIGTMSNSI
ncbi:LexA family transcriptional regulator [Sulfurospirillum arcachonense]|uniref:LexA family transcriptional regulator n=1 Tax=Sulfurospirillum arcachonense TaxID=57666 RepID=UPI0004688F29|nr:LexA family transcriptional regulator [Sulfurospirillum arcachonense]